MNEDNIRIKEEAIYWISKITIDSIRCVIIIIPSVDVGLSHSTTLQYNYIMDMNDYMVLERCDYCFISIALWFKIEYLFNYDDNYTLSDE